MGTCKLSQTLIQPLSCNLKACSQIDKISDGTACTSTVMLRHCCTRTLTHAPGNLEDPETRCRCHWIQFSWSCVTYAPASMQACILGMCIKYQLPLSKRCLLNKCVEKLHAIVMHFSTPWSACDYLSTAQRLTARTKSYRV